MPEQRRPATEDGLVRAVEMVLTPLVFAAAGYGLDTWLGTRPWFTLVLGALALIGKLLVEWYRYAARMDRHEEQLVAGRNTERRDLKTTDAPHDDDLAVADGLAAGVSLDAPDRDASA